MTTLISTSQLAERIRMARKRLGLSQSALATAAGLDQSQVSRMESGKIAQPTVNDIASISMGLGIPRDGLIDMTDQDFKALIAQPTSSSSIDANRHAAERYVGLIEALGGGVVAQEMARDLDDALKSGQLVVVYNYACSFTDFADLMLGLDCFSGTEFLPDPIKPGPYLLAEGEGGGGVIICVPYLADPSSEGTIPLELRSAEGPLLILADGSKHRASGGMSRGYAHEMGELRDKFGRQGPIIHIDFGYKSGIANSIHIDQFLPARSAWATLPIYEYSTDMGKPSRHNQLVEGVPGGGQPPAASLPPGIHPLAEGQIPLGTMEVQSAPIAVGAEQGMLTENLLISGINSVREEVLARTVYGATLKPGAVVAFSPNPGTTRLIAEMIIQDGRRADDLIVAPISAADAVLAYNPLAVSSQGEIEDTAEMVRCFMVESLGLGEETHPRALTYAYQGVSALCEANLRGLSNHPELQLTLLQLPLFFTDQEFRHTVMEFCTNLTVREMFAPDGPYEAMGQKQQLEHVMPILRAMYLPAAHDGFGNVFGQSEDKLKLGERIRQGKIVLLVGDALMGDPLATFTLGLFASQQVVLAAKQSQGSHPCTLVIDEAGKVMNDTLRSVLPYSSRAGLRVILSDTAAESFKEQDIELIRRSTQSFLSCRLDALSAKTISGLISAGTRHPSASELAALEEDEIWGNLTSDGSARSGPFRFKLPQTAEADIPHGMGELTVNDIMRSGCLETTTASDDAWEARAQHLRKALILMQQQIEERAYAHSAPSKEAPWDTWEWGWGK